MIFQVQIQLTWGTDQILAPNLWCSHSFWVEMHLPGRIHRIPPLFLFSTPGRPERHPSSILPSSTAGWRGSSFASLRFIIKLEQHSSSQNILPGAASSRVNVPFRGEIITLRGCNHILWLEDLQPFPSAGPLRPPAFAPFCVCYMCAFSLHLYLWLSHTYMLLFFF